MRIIRGLDRYPPDAPPSVVAQGTFDGIHLGHQAVIRTAVTRARALGVQAVVVTFDPHPVTVLRPAEAPVEILTVGERLERIAHLGPDVALVIPFTVEVSRVEAETFVREVLVGLLRVREIVVGFNHTFGRGADGTPELLRTLTSPLGVRVHVIPPLSVDGVVVSSSSIRDALRRGDVKQAASLLGRPYTVRGVVARGAERGRTLGFPTANLAAPPSFPLADGVYAGRADWASGSAQAVINVGVRPTFGEASRIIEVHLLDAAPDLYGHALTVSCLARIREETRFSSVEALRARIAEDIRVARGLLTEA
ncbi:MAG TPA: bifunctional riboflavin kinase/FAD synthetase [Methylomirabilota bacterium]|nr:bifunctional riboflavin kinase/FAD synthetase [Methylomirabilota bacterium]